MQQYDASLDVYNNPNNLFVADFVGNLMMNFIPARAKSLSPTRAQISALGTSFVLESKSPFNLPSGESGDADVILGIRPEFILLGNGPHSGKVYATLPAGMETTVKIEIDNIILTSVEFGSVDYDQNSDIQFKIHGDGIILFDAESGEKIGKGQVRYSDPI